MRVAHKGEEEAHTGDFLVTPYARSSGDAPSTHSGE